MVNSYSCTQEMIFSLEQANELKQSLEALPREDFFYEESNQRWGLFKKQPPSHRYEDPHDSWFTVTFGKSGEVIEENVTLPYSNHKNIQTIKRISCIALKWMSEKLSWQGETKPMAMSFMQHHKLYKGQITKEIQWHRDHSNQTLVILLDDEKKWSGGDFLFKVGEEAPQCFQPKLGYGLLFSNEGTQHSVKPLTAISEGIDRTILTFHAKQIQT